MSVPDAQTDTYAVYAAVLDSFALGSAPPPRIASRTRPYALGHALGDTSELYRSVQADSGVGATLLDAYDRANAGPEALCDCFPGPRQVELIPHQAGPDVAGPIMLSGVGFNASRTRALVSVAQVCGPLCGSSAVYLVVRRADGWQVARRVLWGAS